MAANLSQQNVLFPRQTKLNDIQGNINDTFRYDSQQNSGGIVSMRRRDFLKSSVAVAGALQIGTGGAQGMVRAHNWGKYDFGSGPVVHDRLNQGPFPQYPPDAAIPGDEVVMTTTPSDEVVPNYGKGLVTYITADMGTDEIKSDSVSQAIEDLVNFPPRAAALYSSDLAGDAAPAGTARDVGLHQAGLCASEEEKQASGAASSDERS